MYFVVILAFLFVLADTLPLRQCNLFPGPIVTQGAPLIGSLAVVIGQVILVAIVAKYAANTTLSRLDGTAEGHDRAADRFASFHTAFLFILSGLLILTMVCTPWTVLVREGWGLGRVPLLGDLFLILPFILSLLIVWTVTYPVEKRFCAESISLATESAKDAPNAQESEAGPPERENHALSALHNARKRAHTIDVRLGSYLADKLRHQFLILAAPMSLIVLAKHLIDLYAERLVPLPSDATVRDLILNSALGTTSIIVLVVAPWMIRYIWSTEPLPPGPLRDRFVATCRRIGLRYREILIWHTHGMAVNAAVMGFLPPIRYILISDALLETMKEDEIEAVFGHEAGHVQHWHLPFFGLFAVVSMYAAGGAVLLLYYLSKQIEAIPEIGPDLSQLVVLLVLMFMWLLPFGWLSRKFERQADLFGVRCITPDMRQCLSLCPVHGLGRSGGLCISAANLFGRTLARIAELNGIPREAPSWRHGSIESRCRLIETFSADIVALKRFDRSIIHIKVGLVAITLLASAVAIWIYYEPVLRVLKNWSG